MMSARRPNRFIVLAVGVVLLGFALLAATPTLLAKYGPDSLQALPPDQIVAAARWRLIFYFQKATGQVPDLSWAEVIQGTRPDTGFITDLSVNRGQSLHVAVQNPANRQEDLERGEEIFRQQCAICHGEDGRGDAAPSIFRSGSTAGASDLALYTVIRDGIEGTSMLPAGLSIEERWQVVSHVRVLGGTSRTSPQQMPVVNVTWQDLVNARSQTNQWLTYSGALDGWRYSPLSEIDKVNVNSLELLWAYQFTTQDGSIQATPIVTGRTMFLTEPPSSVVAIDAATGREQWRYQRPLPTELSLCCARVNRGLAVLGNRLLWGTLDAKLIALDAGNGRVVWEAQVADPALGFTITTAPLIVNDMAIIGVSGGEFGVRGFVAAYSVDTGEERWRFHTIPGPGEFGHESWENDAWTTGGGPTWITGSYDPELNLLFWGVGNPAPAFAGYLRPGDNLFTNSVIALNATTGELAWHFQFTPHDEHDWDANQTPVIVDLVIDGRLRRVISWANRNGFYYVLDRTTGEFLLGEPFVAIDWASGLDAQGRPILTENSQITPTGTLTRPWIGGGTNWLPPSYYPHTGTFLVHATEGQSVFVQSERVSERRPDRPYVGSGATEPGPVVNILKALDAATGAIRWEYVVPKHDTGDDVAVTYSGVLSTAGGVAFSAAAGTVFAVDVDTGMELWRTTLGGRTQGTPVTFTVDGRQVVAVTAGRTLFVFAL